MTIAYAENFNAKRLRPAMLVICAIALLPLGRCVGMVVGGAATAGVAAYQERGIKGVAADTATSTKFRPSFWKPTSICSRILVSRFTKAAPC